MFKMSNFCHSTPNIDVKHSDIPSGLLLMEYHWWHVLNSMNTRFPDTNLTTTLPQLLLWESCKNLQDCISTLVFSGNSLFFRTDLSTHLSPFHPLQTCLGFLFLLPLVVVVVVAYQIQVSNVVELQQHSPFSNNTSITTYVHRMIISPPCLFKHMKNDERVAMFFQCLLDHT